LRDGQLILIPEITTGLLSMVDAVRQMLKEIESSGQDGDDTYPELIATLTRLQETTSTPGKANLNHPAAENSPPAAEKADRSTKEKRRGYVEHRWSGAGSGEHVSRSGRRAESLYSTRRNVR
jgi:chemotaxis protein histidine kinase CheA